MSMPESVRRARRHLLEAAQDYAMCKSHHRVRDGDGWCIISASDVKMQSDWLLTKMGMEAMHLAAEVQKTMNVADLMDEEASPIALKKKVDADTSGN